LSPGNKKSGLQSSFEKKAIEREILRLQLENKDFETQLSNIDAVPPKRNEGSMR